MTDILDKRSRRICVLMAIVAIVAVWPALYARDYAPDEITNPNVANRYDYVADPERRLDESTRRNVNARLQALRDSTTAEVAVAVVPSIGDYTVEDFSEKVFTRWGLGKKDKDNGVLLLISPDSRQVRIQTGYGAEGVLPDITCGEIIRTAVIPNMKADCLDCAVDEATAMITRIMTDPEYAEELRSGLADNRTGIEGAPVSSETFMSFVWTIVFILWLCAAGYYFIRLRKTKHISSAGKKAQDWRDALTTLGILSFVTLLTALPFYLLALYHYRHARYGKRKCLQCGGESVLLKGDQALGSLTPAQQFESKIGSVVYEVHKCARCGNTETEAYPSRTSPYSYCPHCGTRAYHHTGRHTLRQPTYHSEGMGVDQYKCEYCGQGDDKGFRIPKKDISAALAAAAALGSAGRRHGRGGGLGGGFGGGFGGGSTGGGGASGSW